MLTGTRVGHVQILALCFVLLLAVGKFRALGQEPVFGPKFKNLEKRSTGQWWQVKPSGKRLMDLHVPRNEVVAFAVYTHDHGVLKLSAQLFPLLPDEPREVRLELQQDDGSWQEAAKQNVIELGWSAHFRIENWNNQKNVRSEERV